MYMMLFFPISCSTFCISLNIAFLEIGKSLKISLDGTRHRKDLQSSSVLEFTNATVADTGNPEGNETNSFELIYFIIGHVLTTFAKFIVFFCVINDN